jgi:hypothetical protein
MPEQEARLRMRTLVLGLAILSFVGIASRAEAQEVHAAPQAALDAALQEHASASTADREAVLRLLERKEVKEVAGKAGLDVRRAAAAVATLEGQALADVVAQARQVEQALAGGQSSITISTTLIIIGLLVLILVIVLVS